ncbi:uncharacterized protein PST29_4560 [Pseudomonas sp. St29]|nr:uncharacterized protein PST29_4560 [Pseudomonas sp. St29]
MAGRPFEFPDPSDCSPNSPTVIAKANQVLGNYNRANPTDKRQKVTDPVRNWFNDQALKEGWKTAEFHGSDCLLTADVVLRK